MSDNSCQRSEDELSTTPCGHSLHRRDIIKHWDHNDTFQCPVCKKVIENSISGMVAEFTHETQQAAKPGEVLSHPVPHLTVSPLKTEDEIQQMTQKRRLKIEEMKESVTMSKDAADSKTAECVQIFTALKESVERGLNQLIKEIEDKQKTTEKQAEGFIKDLEQEVSGLMKRSSEVAQLSKYLPDGVCPPSYEWTVVRAVTHLEETLSKDMKKLLEAELKRLQQYAVDVTLDPDTAHPHLILSGDGKQVNHSDEKKNLPDNPERFSTCVNVLGNQSFSSGRFYFQVEVKGKFKWCLGVARESINRKGEVTPSPQNGFWIVWLSNRNEYKACAGPSVSLSLGSRPEKVGVFVDYEEGLVSFHDVDTAALIYSFTGCSFTEKLYPFFNPGLNHGGKNSAPLIICPVNQTV